MKVEVKIDAGCPEPKVIILTSSISPEVESMVQRLSQESPQMIAGFREDTAVILEQAEIVRVYSAASKVFAVTADGEYLLRLRLYELEERLDGKAFVRISNSEIINLKKVKSFDLSFTGTICVSFTDGTVTYASRRYVARVKKILGI